LKADYEEKPGKRFERLAEQSALKENA